MLNAFKFLSGGIQTLMKKQSKDSHWRSNRKLLEDESFIFECHPDMDCFTRCCRDADMYLYPYDIIRLKSRLALSSEQFLEQHTTLAFRDNPFFPSVMLKMSDKEDKACPFLSSHGCSVYEDRPFSCRAYPLERAVARVTQENRPKEMYFLVRHSHCSGHQEIRKWTVPEWLDDQQIKDYNKINDRWSVNVARGNTFLSAGFHASLWQPHVQADKPGRKKVDPRKRCSRLKIETGRPCLPCLTFLASRWEKMDCL